MPRSIATNRTVERADLLDFLRPRHRVILLTPRADGGWQGSPVTSGVDPDGRIVISTYPERAKASNVARHGRAAVVALSDDFDGPWVQVEGPAELLRLPEALEPLVEYFRSISGEHPDWDSYRAAMTAQGKALHPDHPATVGADRHRRLPGPAGLSARLGRTRGCPDRVPALRCGVTSTASGGCPDGRPGSLAPVGRARPALRRCSARSTRTNQYARRNPCGRGPATPTRSAPPTTAPAPTSRCSPRSRRQVELCLFDARRQGDSGSELHRGGRLRLARLPARASSPGSATATGCTARTTRRSGQRCNPTKLLLDPYAKALDGPVDWDEAVFGYPFGDPDERNDTDSAPFVPKSVVVNPFFDWGTDRPPRIPYHETVIYEAHVRGLTIAHPEIPERAARHLRRAGAPGDDRPPASGSASPRSS